MIDLANDQLTVTLLDPESDRDRFGTRYCTGGYIFQIADRKVGDLLSGPTYPEDFNTFDGQGIPDSFNQQPLRDQDSPGSEALIVGVGRCDLEKDEVLAFDEWTVSAESDHVLFSTTQTFQSFELELKRRVSLHGRTIRSSTTLSNPGKRIPLRWFPHPFYPHPDTDELCRFNIAVSFPENEGYALSESGFIRRSQSPWESGYFQALDHDATQPLVVLQKHPGIGLVGATTSYVPGFFPIWGNANTFSWEPYLERTVPAGQTMTWWIDYEF